MKGASMHVICIMHVKRTNRGWVMDCRNRLFLHHKGMMRLVCCSELREYSVSEREKMSTY